jgi:signal transduction histidine kinase
VRDVVALETMGEDQVRWTLSGDDAPVRGMARQQELREVLLNVFENARLARATDVRTQLDATDGQVRIVVRDNGHGIPRAVLSRIFEPHFSTRTSGSGLGLAISRRMIESWGGTIDLASEEGKGTAVTIRLVAA